MPESQIPASYTIDSISALSDNYFWVINNKANNQIAILDPGDAQACIDYIETRKAQVTDILITHRHYDHTDGVDELMSYCQKMGWNVNLYGPATDNLPFESSFTPLAEDDLIRLNFDNKEKAPLDLTVLSLFGHTKGQIGYLLHDALFCADAIFSVGCGRLFDGTAEQLWHSLAKIRALPDKTQLYCSHEYTLANINFALTIEPENEELIHYFNVIKQRRENNISTVPTSLLQEKKVNPFIRCHLSAVQQNISEITAVPFKSELDTFTLLRKLKDNF